MPRPTPVSLASLVIVIDTRVIQDLLCSLCSGTEQSRWV